MVVAQAAEQKMLDDFETVEEHHRGNTRENPNDHPVEQETPRISKRKSTEEHVQVLPGRCHGRTSDYHAGMPGLAPRVKCGNKTMDLVCTTLVSSHLRGGV